MLKTSSHIGRDKSFVDDLNKERGIVRMRVAFVPRSAEIQPLFWRFVNTQIHQTQLTNNNKQHFTSRDRSLIVSLYSTLLYSTLLYSTPFLSWDWARLDLILTRGPVKAKVQPYRAAERERERERERELTSRRCVCFFVLTNIYMRGIKH
jgi:hypothetical protein